MQKEEDKELEELKKWEATETNCDNISKISSYDQCSKCTKINKYITLNDCINKFLIKEVKTALSPKRRVKRHK